MAGALGPACPSQDVLLSAQHRVLVAGPIAQRMFGRDEVLIPAKALLELPGVFLEPQEKEVTYFHIMLGTEHHIVFVNDMQAESLFLGREALKALPHEAVEDLCLTLGVSADLLQKRGPCQKPARPLIRTRLARKLVWRHIKNTRALVG